MCLYLNSTLLVHWIHNGDTASDGSWRCIVFLLNALISVLIKNGFTLHSKLVAVSINKCVATVLYSKILKMSQKSLAVTSTGKLVTLVSGELQTIEKTFFFIPLSLSSFFVLLMLFAYIAYFFEEASAIAFGVLLVMIVAFLTLAP